MRRNGQRLHSHTLNRNKKMPGIEVMLNIKQRSGAPIRNDDVCITLEILKIQNNR